MTQQERAEEMRDEVAAEVRAMAARKGYRQVRVAQIIGESQSTVSRLLSGQRPFDIDHLSALAAEWDVPITELIPSRATPDQGTHVTCSAPSAILVDAA
jgi:transcriptional regulator with XRE-family HTH domain